MTRIGILVQPDFLDHHVGVRNFLFTLYQYLAPRADVRFLSFYRPRPSMPPHWYWVHLRNPNALRNNGVREDRLLRGTPAEVFDQYLQDPHPPAPAANSVWHAEIGPRLENAEIDVLVIGNPWTVNFAERLPVPRQIGIVHDAIPNRYCLTEVGKPFEFAADHLNGFRYFRDHCDATLANSDISAGDLVDLLHFSPAQAGWLPPMVPVDCLTPAADPPPRTNTILLASPLDRRKGLAAIPRLVAAVGPKLEALKMYGGVRCSPDELKAFFRDLPRRLPLDWYPQALSKTTERLFREAKLTLFPSLHEGLGIPLLESQLRGCPVVTRNARPMSDLIVDGSRLLTDDPVRDGAIVRELFATPTFDHAGVEARAREFFQTATLPDRVYRQVMGEAPQRAVARAA